MDHLKRAEHEWKNGRLAEAESAYRDALAREPGHAGAIIGLAGVLADQDRFDAALRVLGRLTPASAEEDEAAGRMRADILCRTGRVEEAIGDLRALVAHHPSARGAWQDLALTLAAADRATEADHALADALAALPGDARIWASRGMIAALSRRPADAVAGYERALRQGASEDRAWRDRVRGHLAAAHDQAGDTSRALAEYRELVAEAPDVREAWIQLGTLLWREDRFEEAARTLELAHRRWPEEHDIAYYLADSWKNLGRLEDAERVFRASIERVPECVNCLYGLAEVVHETERPGEAALLLRHVVAARPDDPDVLGLFAAARFDIGEADAARSLYERVFVLAPKEFRHPYNLALREREAGRLEAASALFDRALEVAPQFDRALYFSMVCRIERGLISESLPLLERFVALVPPSRPMVRADPLLDPLKSAPEYRRIANGGILDFAAPDRPGVCDAIAAIARSLPVRPGASRPGPHGPAGSGQDMALDAAVARALEAASAVRARRSGEHGPPRYFFEAVHEGDALVIHERDASRLAESLGRVAAIERTGEGAYRVTAE